MKSCIPGDSKEVTPSFTQISENGAIVTEISQMLLPEEADYIVNKAHDKGSHQSTVMGKEKNEYSRARSSSTSFLKKNQDEVVSCIEKRIATVAQQPIANLEPLQVTSYSKGQKYDPHHDYFHSENIGKYGQRTTTVFTYLNTVDSGCGGATAFPRLKDSDGKELKVFPSMGNAVMWSNKTTAGEPNELTLHGGESVTCAATKKYGLNAWFRENKWS